MLCRSVPLRALSRTPTSLKILSTNNAYAIRTLASSTYTAATQPATGTPAAKSRENPAFQQRRTYAQTPMAAPTDTAAEQVAASTGITPDTLSETLRQKLEATHVDIQDISGGCGASFTALIVSPQFQGKTALARHRLVNSALKSEIAAIHAWTPKCLTPEQWDKLRQENGS